MGYCLRGERAGCCVRYSRVISCFRSSYVGMEKTVASTVGWGEEVIRSVCVALLERNGPLPLAASISLGRGGCRLRVAAAARASLARFVALPRADVPAARSCSTVFLRFRGKCGVRHYKDVAALRDFPGDSPDTFFYILGYNPENNRLASILGEIRVGSAHQVRTAVRTPFLRAHTIQCASGR